MDDNLNGLTARRTVLQELGHKVTAASSGADALEQFAHQKFDLVITDYKMPRMDGLELIGEIRARTPEMPIILVSGFVDALGLSEETTGADAVIQKSAHEVTHLTRAVARLLRRKSSPRKPPGQETRPPKSKRKSV